MARQRLQRCLDCGAHGLSTTCSECGGVAQAAAPMKWSPDDPQAHRRRQRLGVEEKGWTENLPQPIALTSSEEE